MNDSRQALDLRLARGEITEKEYRHLLRTLQSVSAGYQPPSPRRGGLENFVKYLLLGAVLAFLAQVLVKNGADSESKRGAVYRLLDDEVRIFGRLKDSARNGLLNSEQVASVAGELRGLSTSGIGQDFDQALSNYASSWEKVAAEITRSHGFGQPLLDYLRTGDLPTGPFAPGVGDGNWKLLTSMVATGRAALHQRAEKIGCSVARYK